MTQSKKIILLTTSLILTICLMAFFGVYALTTLKNSTFNVGVKYEPEYLVKVEMGIDGANGGTVNQNIEEIEYVEIFNSKNPVSNGMYIQSMSNDTIHINSQTLTPIGANGEVHFKITSLESETGGKDLKCVIYCGLATADSEKLTINTPKQLTISTGINATSGTVTSSSLGMIKINLKFSEFVLDFVDLKDLESNSSDELNFGEAGTIKHSDITGKTFYVSDINGLLKLSALVGKVNTTTTEYDPNYVYGYNNSKGSAVSFSGATIQMLNEIDCGNTSDFTNAKTFIPIGNETNSFQGTFDGNDKTITGLYINQTTNYAGLFGYVLNAEIKNLTMQNCKVVSTVDYVGNFVGCAYDSIISNCSAEKTEVRGDYYVGGIVGWIYETTTITNCYNTGSVRCSMWYVGGIAGGATRVKITNCYNTGSVVSVDIDGGLYIGGIAGQCSGATITNCYNTGSVNGGRACMGGIAGNLFSATTITNCYYLESSSSEAIGGHGTVTEGSYYGKFSSASNNVEKTSSAPLVYNGKILDVLNAYRDATLTYDGIDLKSWKAGSNRYPVFA